MNLSFSGKDIPANIPDKPNASFLRKFAFMTIVVFAVYSILSVVGFYLWFVFPVEKINGLTYLSPQNLILYYLIVNFLDIAGILFFSHIIYYQFVKTTTSIKDGLLIGIYLIIFSWILDLFVYVFIRKTLPTLEEYFLGKNQPEIGIAWLIAFISAVYSGWLHEKNQTFISRFSYKKALMILLILTLISSVFTVVGIRFFDIKP